MENGSYYQRSRGGHIEKMCDQVTIAFSNKEGVGWTIHCHGALSSVQAWWTKNQPEYRDMFGEINLITFPPKFDVDRINRFLELPAQLGALLREQEGLEPRDDMGMWT